MLSESRQRKGTDVERHAGKALSGKAAPSLWTLRLLICRGPGGWPVSLHTKNAQKAPPTKYGPGSNPAIELPQTHPHLTPQTAVQFHHYRTAFGRVHRHQSCFRLSLSDLACFRAPGTFSRLIEQLSDMSRYPVLRLSLVEFLTFNYMVGWFSTSDR